MLFFTPSSSVLATLSPSPGEEFVEAFQSWYKQFKRLTLADRMAQGMAESAEKGEPVEASDEVSGFGFFRTSSSSFLGISSSLYKWSSGDIDSVGELGVPVP
jgi:hypothetical protein